MVESSSASLHSARWGQVKKWHRKEQKRYEEAVKLGLVPVKSTMTHEPSSVVMDGDVGCTGAVATAGKSEETTEEMPVTDPGPMPKNIYNQGFK